MNLLSVLGAIEIGMIFALVGLGVLIAFRVLNFPDMTADGSFPLGGAVAAVLLVKGLNPFLATAIAALIAGLAGFVTAWLNVRMKVMQLLAGILVMIALYSINLRVMSAPNVPLINAATVFTLTQPPGLSLYWSQPLVLSVVVLVITLLVNRFFSSEIGLAMRATGVNARMARAQGVSTDKLTLLGITIANSLIGLAGALFAQTQGGADISMGIGTIVAGLAAVIIGETLISARKFWITTISCVLGAVLYRFFIALALSFDSIGLQAQDLNLVTAILVATALFLPNYKKRFAIRSRAKTCISTAEKAQNQGQK
ncbi:MAG: inner-rane translocator [Solimicrobium sp.]|jgi:putative ABC transport system permease protein|nr:inner-rane translocator [Solimicrobium sp.]